MKDSNPSDACGRIPPSDCPINMGYWRCEDYAGNPGPHLPQGQGHRQCIGNSFARQLATPWTVAILSREHVTQAVKKKPSQGGRRPGKPWLECAGELAHLHGETLRIQKIIDEEFEQIEPEDWT